MIKSFRFELRLLITLAYAGVVFYMMTTVVNSKTTVPHIDKLYHVVVFSVLAIMCIWSLRLTRLRNWKWTPYAGAVVAIIYGIITECYQTLVPYRDAEVNDAIANVVGALLAIPISYLLLGIRDKLKEKT